METSKATMNTDMPINAYVRHVQRIRAIISESKSGGKFGIEKWFIIGLALLLFVMPITLVRCISGYLGKKARKIAIEFYAIAKPIILIYILSQGLSYQFFSLIVACVFLIDLYSYILSLIFMNSLYTGPASYGRSLLLLIINFIESACAFAVIYLYTNTLQFSGGIVESWSMAVYFSIITAATVGYGDVTPDHLGRLFVVLQVILSLLYVTIILSSYVGRFFSPSHKIDN